jgi:prepilin-type N-terminal cleavage/methylation domain-containing protein
MKPHCRFQHSWKSVLAFTLMELLVVIMILGVLAALLLPVLNKVKQKAFFVPCVNNNRQLLQAWTVYADEHDGELPPNFDGSDGLGVFTNWVAGTMSKPEEATNVALLLDPNKSLLAIYLQSASIFKCPSDRSGNVRSMSMNNRMNPRRYAGPPLFTGGLGTNFMIFRKLHDIARPADIMVTLDERSDSINDGYFAVDMSNTGTRSGNGVSFPYHIVDYPASYHRGLGAISFADGHTEGHEWLESTTTPPLGQARSGFTSTSDRDVRWIQEHCTYPRDH